MNFTFFCLDGDYMTRLKSSCQKFCVLFLFVCCFYDESGEGEVVIAFCL